ncbi:MAG: DNA repair protein RecO [Methylococcales bacterium]|nr:MAG: DNA repair protein RecO [Methylococcales bacterium]
MTDNTVYLQPAFVLTQRQYRETSLIIDVLTRDFGRVPLLAKGVRKSKSKTAGLLQPFIPLTLSYSGKSELKILTHVEITEPFINLEGITLYCGFYINELISRFLHQYDPHPEVFMHYKNCIVNLLNTANVEATLRIFELDLMEAVGYGLQLDYDLYNDNVISPLAHYHFDIEQGPVEATDGTFSGKTLLAIKSRNLIDSQVLYETKVLMRKVISTFLNGKPLKSRAVINQIMHHLEK